MVKKMATNKSKKSAVKSAATVAPETEQPKIKTGKYGAPVVRPNRGHDGKSEFGDRKKIFMGVTAVDKSGNITATDPALSMPLDLETAETVLAIASKRPDFLSGRLWYKKSLDDGTKMRGVYVAFKHDNGVTV